MAKSNHWLVKTEPSEYSWAQLTRDGRTHWSGVRNYEARNNLRRMRRGDQVLFYHSNSGQEIVGIATVAREAYPDPDADSGDWSAVDLEPRKALEAPVTLFRMKNDPDLVQLALLRKPRLSVMPVTPPEFQRILALGRSHS